jgi:flagellar basal-body rod modification protein FlgD
MASAINPLSSSSSSTSTSGSSSTSALGGGSAPSEQMFLQLLVAQLQNQDPLNPQDGTQFVSQLAQFSELENVMGIRQDIESQMASASTSAAATQTAAGSGNSNSGTAATNSIS